MKTLLSTVAAGSVLAAGLLLACGGDDESNPATNSPSGADAAPDTAPAVDAGTTTPTPDAASTDAGVDSAIPRPPFDASAPEITCAVTPCMKSIVAGPQNYCATDSDGVVRCWGQSYVLGSFVDGADPKPGATPVVIGGLGTIQDIAISNYETCVVTAEGTVSCFGMFSSTPQTVDGVANAKKLSIGDNRKCAVLTNGELSCWGDNYSTGNGSSTLTFEGESVVSSLSRRDAAFMLGSKGTLYSWGNDRYTIARSTAIAPDLTPGLVADLPPIMQITGSDEDVSALATDGRLFAWGHNYSGALGLGYVRYETRPVEVIFPGIEWPTQVVTAQTHSCARMTDGSLMCWAAVNWFGELGYPATIGVFSPTKVTSVTKKVASVAVGNGSTCALLEDGSVQCWGDNSYGQLAQGTFDTMRHPTPATVVFP